MGVSVPLDWSRIINKPVLVNTVNGASGAVTAVGTDQGHDAIGSFCFAAHATVATAISAGSTYAGSALRAGGVLGTDTTINRASIDATALSGTWRALGAAKALASNNGLTLFQRIA